MQLPPPHAHDTASPRGSCSVCFEWSLTALTLVMGSRVVGVALPRVFDKSTRTWRDDPRRIPDPPYGDRCLRTDTELLTGGSGGLVKRDAAGACASARGKTTLPLGSTGQAAPETGDTTRG